MRNKKIKFMGLRSKISLLLFSIVSIIGLITAIFLWFFVNESFVSFSKDNISQLLKVKVTHLEYVFDISKDLSKRLSANSEIISFMVSDNDGDFSKLNQSKILEIFKLENIDNQYSAIYLMDSNGLTLVSTEPTFVNHNYGYRPYFIEAMKGNVFVDVALGATSKKVGYYFSSPVYDDSGSKVIGVVVVKLLPSVLAQISEEEYILSDEYGMILYSENKQDVFKSFGFINSREKKDLHELGRYKDIKFESLGFENLQHRIRDIVFLEEKNSSFSFIADNSKYFFVSRIGSYPFFFIHSTNSDLFSKTSKIIILKIGFITLSGVIISALIFSLLLPKIFLPLKDLHIFAKQIKANNFSERIKINSNDELEDLGNVLNKMADKLVKEKKDIEQRVSEKTNRLIKINKMMVRRELKMVELKEKIKEKK